MVDITDTLLLFSCPPEKEIIPNNGVMRVVKSMYHYFKDV